MSRSQGLSPFSANFEPRIASPLDARGVVDHRSDLTSSTTWAISDTNTYTYKGMRVSVVNDLIPENNGLYILIDEDYKQENNWKLVDTYGNTLLEFEMFTLINSNTGVLTLPTHATLVLNKYPNLNNGLLLNVDPVGLRPIKAPVLDGSENIVSAILENDGSYTLSDTPFSYPVALIYQISIPFKYIADEITFENVVNESNLINAQEVIYDDTHLTGFNNVQDIVDQIIKNYNNTMEPTGFVDQDKITVTYDSVARTMTLTHASGLITYLYKGKEYNLSSPWVSPPHQDNSTANFLSSADGLIFGWTITSWSYEDIHVARVRFISNISQYIGFKETHGCNMSSATHKELHDIIGTYRIGGLGIDPASILINPANNDATNSGNRPRIYAGNIKDEDLTIYIPETPDDSVYTTIWFNATGQLQAQPNHTDIYMYAANLFQYNPVGSGLVNAVNNRFYNTWNFHLPVTADAHSQRFRSVWLVAQVVNTSPDIARAEDPRSLYWGELADQIFERVPYAVICLRADTAIIDTVLGQCKIAENPRYLTGSSLVLFSGSPAMTSHSVLSGRNDIASHPDYAIATDTTGFLLLTPPTDQLEMNTLIDTYLNKLLPAKPQNLSAIQNLSIVGAYSASESGTGTIHPICTDSITPDTTTANNFWDGDEGTLSVEYDTIEDGNRILSPVDDTGTYISLRISSDVDYYVGQAGKEGFWTALTAFARRTLGLSVGAHSVQLKHTKTGNTNLVEFYVDDPVTPSVQATPSVVLPAVTRYISGVPSFAAAQQVQTSFSVLDCVKTHYNSVRAARVQGTEITAINLNAVSDTVAGSIPINNDTLAYNNKAVTLLDTVYNENVQLNYYAYNSKNVISLVTAVPLLSRIDTVSNESSRFTSGPGQYPAAGYGSAFDSSISLVTLTSELQLINGRYRYPTGNYASNAQGAGPNYTGLAEAYRYVTFRPVVLSAHSAFTLTIVGSVGTWTGASAVTSGIQIYARVDGAVPSAGWIDCNAAYPGTGNPTNNGDPAMVVGSSTFIVKRVTFGTAVKTGQLTIRIGIPVSSDKQFQSIIITALS